MQWPGTTEFEDEFVFAAVTTAERVQWCNAFQAETEEAERRARPGYFDAASVPTAGWLLKKGGRKTGLSLFGWKKRWFIFTPATKELRYLEAPRSAKAKGVIVMGADKTDVFVPESAEGRGKGGGAFCFCVSTLGNTKVNTMLQAADADDLEMWLTALRLAVQKKQEKKPDRRKSRKKSTLAAAAVRKAGGEIGGDTTGKAVQWAGATAVAATI